jgi:hypothetical protein
VVRLAEPPERVNTQGIYVVADDADAHCARARAADTRSCASS